MQFVDETGTQGFVGFGESLKRRENVVIHGSGLGSTEFCDGKCQRSQEFLMSVDELLGNRFLKKRSIGRQVARMLALIAVRGNKISAVDRAVDGHFALGATADRTYLFGFGRAESLRLAPLADWAGPGHEAPQRKKTSQQNTPAKDETQKSRARAILTEAREALWGSFTSCKRRLALGCRLRP